MSHKYEPLGGALAAAAGRGQQLVRLSFAEIDVIVQGLPPSARRHRPWWANGGQPHSSVWLSAGWRVEAISLEQQWVRFARARDAAEPDGVLTSVPRRGLGTPLATTHAVREHESDLTKPVVVLIGCVKSKRPLPAPAKDLYDSALFTRRRAYAQNSGTPWFILSSQWGLLDPDQVIAPYDMYLADQPASYRRVWGQFVAEQLAVRHPLTRGAVIELHAGDAYTSALREPFTARGFTLRCAVDAKSLGQTLQWYDRLQSPMPARDTGEPEDVDAVPVPTLVRGALAALSSRAHALAPARLRDKRTTGDLAHPGLYSWWVDAPGARDLSQGLGVRLDPGLIYAGAAGATRWPSGRTSRNSLRDRIVDMHLDGSINFSTFRKTLAAILQRDHDGIRINEASLSAWMNRHLCAATWPTSLPDFLGEVELAVLHALDPPLNLRGMAQTDIRSRIRHLRSRVSP